MDCPFTNQVWKEIISMSSGKGHWEGASLVEGFKKWVDDSAVKDHKDMPYETS
jgi:hypothetical protein